MSGTLDGSRGIRNMDIVECEWGQECATAPGRKFEGCFLDVDTSAPKLRLGKAAASVAVVVIFFAISPPSTCFADEGGVSFWYPGTYGSLAAELQEPGWSLSVIDYHATLTASGETALQSRGEIGGFPAGPSATASTRYGEYTDQVFVEPTYVFATPFLGGQASIGISTLYGRDSVTLSGVPTDTTTGPLAPSENMSESATGFGDLFPAFSLRWNQGVNNLMTYVTGDIPVGTYSPVSLAYLGLGHGAIDAGTAYTYFNAKTGQEFSGTLGFTYNFIDPSTQYQSGVDMHFDWGASHFWTERLHIGLVGYVYREIGCDRGSGDRVGCFQSQVMGVGPQVGFIFPVGAMEGYLNLRAYKEFEAENRPDGWNAWISFELSPAPQASNPPSKPLITK
jgi:hypothetical protein